jgi:hypothetical protein
MRFLSRLASPTALLYVLTIIAQLASGIYLAGEVEPPPAFTLLYALSFLWVMGWWLLKDSKLRGVSWVLDMGLFLYIAWPIVMPYYLIKTRGWRGLLAILVFAVVYVAASMAGVALYAFLAA